MADAAHVCAQQIRLPTRVPPGGSHGTAHAHAVASQAPGLCGRSVLPDPPQRRRQDPAAKPGCGCGTEPPASQGKRGHRAPEAPGTWGCPQDGVTGAGRAPGTAVGPQSSAPRRGVRPFHQRVPGLLGPQPPTPSGGNGSHEGPPNKPSWGPEVPVCPQLSSSFRASSLGSRKGPALPHLLHTPSPHLHGALTGGVILIVSTPLSC